MPRRGGKAVARRARGRADPRPSRASTSLRAIEFGRHQLAIPGQDGTRPRPPSTVSTCAVIQPDSGEARNTTALAMSSGSPMRLIIARAARRSSVPGQSAAPRPRCVMSVRTKPGADRGRWLARRSCRRRGGAAGLGYAYHARNRRDVADEIEIELAEQRRVARVRKTSQKKRGAVTTAWVAMFVPAPGRFSMTNGWPRRSDSH
jgi:hypothetical protein